LINFAIVKEKVAAWTLLKVIFTSNHSP
jgi:hypothetical protein